MLILTQVDGAFLDSADPAIRYRLPTGLVPAGDHQVVLSRGQGSGLLQLRLAPVWPQLKPGEKRTPFSQGRFHIIMQTPSSTEAGEWRPTPLSGDLVVDRSISLNAAEAAIARRLGAGGGEVVDVEVELTLSGFAPTFSWLVASDGELLRRTVAALLGTSPATWEQVESAFLGLGKELFDWHPLGPFAMPPPLDGALRAIAHHARSLLLENSAAGWTVRTAVSPHLSFSLAVPYLDSKTVGLRWRFSEFLAAQAHPEEYLLDLAVPAPLAGAILLIGNDVPLSTDGIQRIEVEVKTGGPSGRVSHVFLPSEPSAARVPFVRQTFEELALECRAILTVQTARGPAVVEAAAWKTGMNIQVTAERIGLTALRFRASPEVFTHAAAIEVTAGTRTLVLTAQQPDTWAVGRTPPATCQVSAAITGGPKTALGEYPVNGGLTVDATMLGLGEVVPMVFRPTAGLASRAAYLAVQVENGAWRSLDFDGEITWPIERVSRLEPARLRYRTRHVPLLPGGATGPLAESGWKTAESTPVEVGV